MEPILRSAQVLKQAEGIGYVRKEVAEICKQHEALDRVARAACRDTQKIQAQANVELAKLHLSRSRREKEGR